MVNETEIPPASGPRQEDRPRIQWLSVQELIIDPLPEPAWAVKELQMCPGRPPILGGYGASGKTIAAQALALACVTGRPVWGRFQVSGPMRVRHVDYELGKGSIAWRYRRLAHGMGITPEELFDALRAERLKVSPFTSVYLNDPDAFEVYVREVCTGADLVIIDAFRGATPGEEENDSGMRRFLDLLGRVSTQTGTTILVLHHAKKGDDDADEAQALRGSSAIYDGAGAIFMLRAKEQNDPKHVKQTRASQDARGRILDPFYLEIEDVPVLNDPTGGLLVSYRTVEQIETLESPEAVFGSMVERVYDAIRRKPNVGGRALRQLVKGNNGAKAAAVEELFRQGRIRKSPDEKGWVAVEAGS